MGEGRGFFLSIFLGYPLLSTPPSDTGLPRMERNPEEEEKKPKGFSFPGGGVDSRGVGEGGINSRGVSLTLHPPHSCQKGGWVGQEGRGRGWC